MQPAYPTGQHFLDSLIDLQQQEADRIMRYVMIIFFLLGLVFSVQYNSWILSVPLGGLCLGAYFLAQFTAPESPASRWVAAAVIPVFTAQYVYQLHGSLDPHLFFFLGSTVLIIYQDWKLFIVSSGLFALHLVLFSLFHTTEPLPEFLENAKHIGLTQTLPHFLALAGQTALCIGWAELFNRRAEKAASQLGQMEHYTTELTKQKDLLERQNVALDAQLEERHLKMREANEKVREKDSEKQALEKNLKAEIHLISAEKEKIGSELEKIKSVFDPVNLKSSLWDALKEQSGWGLVSLKSDGTISEINDAFSRMTGYLPSELKNFSGLISENELAKIAAEAGKTPELSVLFQPGEQKFIHLLSKDGSAKMYDCRAVQTEDVILLGLIPADVLEENEKKFKLLAEELQSREEEIRQNMDELAATNDELERINNLVKEREAFLQTVINQLPVAVMCKNTDSQLTLINDKTEEIFGIKKEDLGKSINDSLPVGVAARLAEIDRNVFENRKAQTDELNVNFSEKENRFVLLKNIPIEGKNGSDGLILTVAEDITDRKNAQALFETLASSSPIPFVVTSAETSKIIYVNEPLCEKFGFKTEELVGKTSPNYYHSAEARKLLIEKIMTDGYVNNYECQLVKKDGTVFWALVNLRLAKIFNEKCFIGGIIDIDDQKRTQEIIKAGQIRLAETFELAELGTWELDFRTMKIIFDRRHTGWLGEKTEGNTGITLSFKDFTDKYLLENSGIHHLAESLIKGETSGTARIEYDLKNAEGKILHFSAGVKPILNASGKTVRALATVQNITERKQYEISIFETQKRVEDAARLARLSFWDMDFATNIFTLDREYARILGIPETDKYEILGDDFIANFVPPGSVENLTGVFGELIQSNDPNYILSAEYPVKRTDGAERMVFTVARLEVIKGVPIKILGVTQDVTDQKALQKQLIEAQSKSTTAMSLASLGIWEVDLETVILYCDSIFASWLGLETDETGRASLPLSEYASKYLFEEEVGLISKALEGSFAATEDRLLDPLTYRLKCVDGTVKEVDITGNIYLENGKPRRVLGSIQDVTEQKKLEKEIKIANEKIKSALQLASLAVWELDLISLEITFDALHASWIGVNLREDEKVTLPLMEFAAQFVVPDDIPLIQRELEFALSRQEDSRLNDFTYRLNSPDFGILQLSVGGFIYVENGKPIRILGSTQDITERKKLETEVKIANRKAVEGMKQAGLGIFEYLPATNEFIINEVFCEWTGMQPDEKGNKIMDANEYVATYLYEDEIQTVNDAFGAIFSAVEDTPLPPFEYSLNSKARGKMRLAITGFIYCENGKPDRVLGSAQDITETRKLEQSILEAQSRFTDMAANVPGVIYQLSISPENQIKYSYISPVIKTILNIEPEAVIADANVILQRIHPEDIGNIPFYDDAYVMALQNLPLKAEFRVVKDDGTYIWGEINGQTRIAENEFLTVNGVIIDVTARKEAEIEAREREFRTKKHERVLNILNKSEILASGELSIAFQQICEMSADALEVAMVGIWSFDDSYKNLTCEVLFDARTFEFRSGEIRTAEKYPKHFEALRSDAILNVKYVNFNPATSELRDDAWTPEEVNSLLALPVRRKGVQVGVIFAKHSGIARQFNLDEEAFLISVSELVTLAYESKDKRDALEALKLSNSAFTGLQKAVPGVVNQFQLKDGIPSFPFISDRCLEVFGISAQEAMNDYNAMIGRIHAEDLDAFKEAQMMSMQNQTLLDFTGRGVKPDGAEIWFQILGSGEWLSENHYLANGIILDVTERKERELIQEKTQERILLQDTALKELSQSDFISDGTVEEHYDMILEAVGSILETSYVFLMFADEDFNTISVARAYLPSEEVYLNPEITVQRQDTPIFFEALISERSIINSDTETITPLNIESKFYFDVNGVKSFLSASIIRGGKISGAIAVEMWDRKREWQFDEVNFMQGVAEIISISLESKARNLALKEIQEKESELRLALNELQSAQNQVIQSEKMASLGQLVAGVAHEINTPISAVKASTRNLFRTLPVVLTEVPTLLRNLTNEEADLFIDLVQQSANQNTDLTTQEERQYRMKVKATLDEYDVEDSFELAKELVEVRIVDNLEQFVSLFNHPQSSDIIDKVYKLGQFKKNMENIDMAAEKTARVARALKNYSRVQSSDVFTEVFIHESIETILTIYSNQLKYGIDVVKNFQPMMKPVPVFPDEIGQVWTNILNNAIQALKGKGKITIDVLTEGENALVRITDNGPGIPADIINRIFEPFFTTKPQGEGTGLGLDICRKIVEKHSGTISVESEPGRTAFLVSLPMKQDEDKVEKMPEAQTADAEI